ncbi:MAG: 30S ribosomal protein S9 [Candidatus Diapherotrites archaeon]|nr:30S ribosomal protein S9 [Candidatus Diapherotrites archaeon]
MARKSKKGITSKAKKKTAVARAAIHSGRGRVTINKRALETIEPSYLRTFIAEPLIIAGEIAKKVDIEVTTRGGGFMGQAVSARSAIAKALVAYTKDKNLERRFREYDRLLLVDDSRRKEPKKPLGRGARAKKQKSKR